jgi:hypothetical protein
MPESVISDTSMNEMADERSARELAKLIGKLRWIGEDDKAEELQRKLRAAGTRECILAVSGETD